MTQSVAKAKDVTLLDLLDRALDKGVFLWGDITISVAEVDLVYVGLKVLLTSIETANKMRMAAAAQYSSALSVHSDAAQHP